MTKITNLGKNPVSVYCGGISMAIGGGASIDSENFTEAEVKFYRAYPEAFSVEGDAKDLATNDPALLAFHNSLTPIAKRVNATTETFAQAVNNALDENDKLREKLADIVALFGTDEVDELNVKAAVELLLQDQKKAMEQGNVMAGKPTTIAEAVQLLDDTNDDHWTQTGKPKIAAIETILGSDVTAAQYDQLPDSDKRVRKV